MSTTIPYEDRAFATTKHPASKKTKKPALITTTAPPSVPKHPRSVARMMYALLCR